ncbi:MAG: FRG domain-containing protein [Clostridium sp.]|uniref:FRG domain-containing protein n=1 Tax=Clostridium sp. TaxID=1506 RepID=UPI0028FEE801|nr:FRG domain-containing protein [Clostridium sp.]MDU2459777.1 FRG domain-containing protein [Clostridium sp.]
MVLERLYGIIKPLIDNDECSNSIYEKISLEEIDTAELVDKMDEEIKKFIDSKDIDLESKDVIFKLIQKVKIEKDIEIITSNKKDQTVENEKNRVKEYFRNLIEPDDIEIVNNKITLTFDFNEESKLRNNLKSIESWNKENVVETISKKLNVKLENIVFIDNLTSYIEFIATLEKTNYVSRGQKDCTYDLVPSLHRIYCDGFKNHLSQYEADFRQKVLYYDNSIRDKSVEELRAYAQHFGLPTNYLDFTEAHLISLLFAVEEFDYRENHSIVYFVDALSYNKEIIRDEIKLVDFSDKELKTTKERQYSDKSYFIKVGNSNERIHFQKGCFLKVEANDSLKNLIEQYSKIVIIDKDSKEEILKELFNLGITFENIYPDKDNVVKTIKFIRNNINQL